MRLAAAALALATASCGREDVELTAPDAGDPVIPGLVALAITPGDTRIDVDAAGAAATVAFTADGTFDDGSHRDVTTLVAWSVDDATPGTIAGGLWSSSNASGGMVIVSARASSAAATARLAVMLHVAIDDPAFPPPPDAASRFDDASLVIGDPMHGPAIVYPADQVMFPQDLARVLFQYQLAGNDLLMLRFSSPYLDLRVYTTADRWPTDETTWRYLAGSNRGGSVRMSVSGLRTSDPATAWQGPTIELAFARDPVGGAIYYWSSASSGVVMSVLGAATATRFYPSAPDATCVGCHTLSRAGDRMAAGYGGEKLREIAVPDRDVVPTGHHDAGWSAFSPDGHRLVIAQHGVLTLLDADTGASLGAVPTGGALATHPDWSPSGDAIAVATCTSASDNRNVDHCGIARIPYDRGAWGAIETLVPAAAGENDYFPRYSPDGRWLAYVHATGPSREQPSAELRLIPADGGAPEVLVRANQRVGPDDGVLDTASSMPTWAPITDDGVYWLAFASTRAYGKIMTGPDQIWVVAIDPAGDDVGVSYAAFWLPSQDAAQRNHLPVWAP